MPKDTRSMGPWEPLRAEVMGILEGRFGAQKRADFALRAIDCASKLKEDLSVRPAVVRPAVIKASKAARRLFHALQDGPGHQLQWVCLAAAMQQRGWATTVLERGPGDIQAAEYLHAPHREPAGRVSGPLLHLLLEEICQALEEAADDPGGTLFDRYQVESWWLTALATDYKAVLGKRPTRSQTGAFNRVAQAVFRAATGEGVRYQDVIDAARAAAP